MVFSIAHGARPSMAPLYFPESSLSSAVGPAMDRPASARLAPVITAATIPTATWQHSDHRRKFSVGGVLLGAVRFPTVGKPIAYEYCPVASDVISCERVGY